MRDLTHNGPWGPWHGIHPWYFLKKLFGNPGLSASWGASWLPDEDMAHQREHLNSAGCLAFLKMQISLPCTPSLPPPLYLAKEESGPASLSSCQWFCVLPSLISWEMLWMIKMFEDSPSFFFWKLPLILPRVGFSGFWSVSPLSCGFSPCADGHFELAECYKWGLSLYYVVGNFKDMKLNGGKKDSKILLEEFLPNIILKIMTLNFFPPNYSLGRWRC